MPPIAQQGKHARVEVVEQKSDSTPHACPAARCKHGTPDLLVINIGKLFRDKPYLTV